MSRIYVMRHGSCDTAVEPMSLSAGGQEIIKKASTLLPRDLALQEVYTSCKLRCVQTARIVAAKTGYTRSLLVREELVTHLSSTWLRQLSCYSEYSACLIVTHLPVIQEFLHEHSLLGAANMRLHPGCIFCFHFGRKTAQQIY